MKIITEYIPFIKEHIKDLTLAKAYIEQIRNMMVFKISDTDDTEQGMELLTKHEEGLLKIHSHYCVGMYAYLNSKKGGIPEQMDFYYKTGYDLDGVDGKLKEQMAINWVKDYATEMRDYCHWQFQTRSKPAEERSELAAQLIQSLGASDKYLDLGYEIKDLYELLVMCCGLQNVTFLWGLAALYGSTANEASKLFIKDNEKDYFALVKEREPVLGYHFVPDNGVFSIIED